MMKKSRTENDALGKVHIPSNAYFGAQTQRAYENFPVSGLTSHRIFTFAIVYIKRAAAMVNSELGLLDTKKSKVIIKACDDVLTGKYDDQFIVDVYQAGAGTSHHMNVNEVIANRANELLGASLGTYEFIDPHDDVNMSQSTNDVIPAAIAIAALQSINPLLQTMKDLSVSLFKKGKEFEKVIKPGRTHLQDALPVTLGQEFGAYAKTIEKSIERIEQSSNRLHCIGIGGTGVGTGINTHAKYQVLMVKKLRERTKLPLTPSDNLFEPMQFSSDFLDLSANLRNLATTLIKIGNDLRLLSSGPNAGLAEIQLPEVQPGSSIMPGKVNPSIVEMLTMVCFQVIGYDHANSLASAAGQLELNVMTPLIAYNLLEQIKLITNAIGICNKKCVQGITVNKKNCMHWFDKGSGIAAILNPKIGYDKVADLVKLSLKTGKTIRDLAVEKGYLSQKEIDRLFSLDTLTKPNV
jgi:aspartate ammonia-lyase